MTSDPGLGWDERWRAYFQVASLDDPTSLRPARIVAVHRGALVAQPLNDGDTAATEPITVDLVTPGNADDHEPWPPVVGDWVALGSYDGVPVVRAVLPRRTFLQRPAVSGRSIGQAIAANIDTLLIVEPMKPEPSVGRVERLTALARSSGTAAWLVLTKADLAPAEAVETALAELGRYTDRALAVSVSEPASLEALREYLAPGTTTVLVGRSGAGKSTLTNALLGTDLATGAVRGRDSKGRHTTTSRQLIDRHGVCLIDTPGIRALGVTSDADAIDDAFEDVTVLAARCRYTDCSHTGEPGCAIIAAVKEGTLETSRVERYLRMRRESARLALRQDARTNRQQQRRASKENTQGRRTTMRLKGRT
nr:ribosome small subunit-dependent GTPase A [Actinomyces sp.]